MLDSRFHVFACQAVSDGESYVRATSLSTLQTVLLSSYRTNLLQDMNTTIVSEWNYSLCFKNLINKVRTVINFEMNIVIKDYKYSQGAKKHKLVEYLGKA